MKKDSSKAVLVVGGGLPSHDGDSSLIPRRDIYQAAVYLIENSACKVSVAIYSRQLGNTDGFAFIGLCKRKKISLVIIGKSDINLTGIKCYPFLEDYLDEIREAQPVGVFNKFQITNEELNALLQN